MRYFKKAVPKTPLWLSNGEPMAFPTVNGVHGFLKTEDENLLKEFDLAIKNQRGGVQEITQAEYEDFEKKSASLSGSPQQPWREELSGTVQDTVTPSVNPAEAKADAMAPAPATEPEQPVAPKPGKASKPAVGSRKAKED